MKITTYTSIHNFGFWSQGKDNAEMLSYEQLSEVESVIDDAFPNGLTDRELNDLFWHDFDTVLEWIGVTYEDVGYNEE